MSPYHVLLVVKEFGGQSEVPNSTSCGDFVRVLQAILCGWWASTNLAHFGREFPDAWIPLRGAKSECTPFCLSEEGPTLETPIPILLRPLTRVSHRIHLVTRNPESDKTLAQTQPDRVDGGDLEPGHRLHPDEPRVQARLRRAPGEAVEGHGEPPLPERFPRHASRGRRVPSPSLDPGVPGPALRTEGSKALARRQANGHPRPPEAAKTSQPPPALGADESRGSLPFHRGNP